MINPYFMIMADIIHNQLESIGYATMIFASHNTKFQIDSLNPIISRKVDGIITFLEPDNEVLDICLNQQIPIVLLGRKNTNLKINSVSTDDFLGGYEVGRLLVKRGARNIGYIGAPEEIECSVRRLNGLKASLNELKINYNEDNLRYLKNNNLKSELDVLLNNGVDAIFFFNDVMALEAITVLESKKIKVPNDIKIVGFDDIQSEFFIPIELTTVSSDKVKIVKTAVDLLILNIQERDLTKFNHIDFKVEVKLGNTV
jgi:LacI family transcriptional regulator